MSAGEGEVYDERQEIQDDDEDVFVEEEVFVEDEVEEEDEGIVEEK